ncbi:MAG: translation initiation factor IF-6 [Methanosarcinaceae archaeon]|nr:translation initiation factor IF-6 [Methanosarcinaceae archaeon]
MIRSIKIMDSPVIGVFSTCTEDYCLLPKGVDKSVLKNIEDTLKVSSVSCLINGSILVGSLCRGNSNGFLISGNYGADSIQKETGLAVDYLPGKINAVGNIILANDSAAAVHPQISNRAVEKIEEILKVDVVRTTISGFKTVGMAACVTNKGLVVAPGITEDEFAILENAFGMEPITASVNFGSRMVGSGILANSKNCIAGDETSGYEFGRILEGLNLLDE